MKVTPSGGVTMDDFASLADCAEAAAEASSATLDDDWASAFALPEASNFLLLVAWSGLAELKYLPPPGFVKTEYVLRVAGIGRRNVENADMSSDALDAVVDVREQGQDVGAFTPARASAHVVFPEIS